jgi:hypothetical protein
LEKLQIPFAFTILFRRKGYGLDLMSHIENNKIIGNKHGG